MDIRKAMTEDVPFIDGGMGTAIQNAGLKVGNNLRSRRFYILKSLNLYIGLTGWSGYNNHQHLWSQ